MRKRAAAVIEASEHAAWAAVAADWSGQCNRRKASRIAPRAPFAPAGARFTGGPVSPARQ
jgi:hypothetical protein